MAAVDIGNGDGERLILPYRAIDVTEDLLYVTDVHTPKAGPEYETRNSLRTNPRSTIGYTCRTNINNIRDIVDTLSFSHRNDETAGHNDWYVPLWWEGYQIGNILVESGVTTTVEFDLNGGTFSNRTKVLLIDETGVWYAARISIISGTTTLEITLNDFSPFAASPVTLTNVTIYPLVKGVLDAASSVNVGKFANGSVSVTFQVDPGEYTIASEPPDLSLGSLFNLYDVYLDPWLMSGDSIALSGSTKQDVADYDIGLRTIVQPWIRGTWTFDLLLTADAPGELRALRGFVSRRKGRYKQFVTPRFDVPLKVVGNPNDEIGTQITVYGAPGSVIGDLEGPLMIYVKFANGYYIDSVNASDNEDFSTTLELSTFNLEQTISEVEGVYLLGIARLATDSVTIQYEQYTQVETRLRCQLLGNRYPFELPPHESFSMLLAGPSNFLLASDDGFLVSS